ncbi:MAG: efflux RND transporter permease subunit [Candidatus Pacebacteria bacterium]|nr:efflux RND transporter permease subunit [Candidatus Paceibacterota bacterium]
MYSVWNFFLTRRAFTILAMAAFLIAGVFALIALPKESSPEVVVPVGIVTTVLPGATAADVERLVTDKLEPAVRNVPNIDLVTSHSVQGVSIISAQFLASADIETAIQDLRNAVEGSKRDLPSDAESPTVTKVDFQNQPVLMVGVSSDLTPETLHTLGKNLKDDLQSLEGVSRVELSGVRGREISVILHSDALARHNLNIRQVLAALSGANASAPAGTLVVDTIEYPLQFNGSISNAEDVSLVPIPLATGEVLLRDIATVVDGFERTSSVTRLAENGEEPSYAMTLNVYKSSGANILSVTNRVKERLVELEDTTLTGSSALVIYDAGDEVQRSISELTHAGRDTIILVMIVLLITIGWRESVVAALSIPFSFVIAFLGMWVTGNTINFISLFSLVIAIGILVDSGIVVVEAIHTNRERGMDKLAAAQDAVRRYSMPLIAGTMTTIAVFVPLFFLSGIIGEFIQSIPFTIIAVLLASILVSLGFVPLLALAILKHSESPLAAYREKMWALISTRYRNTMQRLFNSRRYQRLFFAFLGISFAVAIALPVTGLLKSVLFPPSDIDFFYVEMELPQASTLAETDKVARTVEAVVAQNPFVASYLTTVGGSSVFSGDVGGGSSGNSKLANITVNLKKDRGNASSIDIANQMRRDLAPLQGTKGATISVMDNLGGPPSGAPVVVKLWSDSLDNLGIATEMVERLIENIPGTRDITSSLSNDSTELQISVNREKANDYGLSAADVASTLRAAVAGLEAAKVRIDGDDIAVRISLDLNPDFIQPEETTMADADALARIPIVTSRGAVPLGTFVEITAERSSSAIFHENGTRIGSVSAYVDEGVNAIEITKAVREQADQLQLPEGVRLTYGGDDEEIQRTFTEMIVALLAGMVLMFSILVLEFNAFRTTLRLLLAIPLSLTGVLLGLFIMGQALSFTAFLGIIALGGVIINHGILLLDVLHKMQIATPGKDAMGLVLDASVERIRPILLTTITTVVGMIPLTFVSAMWAPLAFTIGFGLIYGTLLTLVLIPVLSYRHELKRQRRAKAAK